jgi:hypothetical protein
MQPTAAGSLVSVTTRGPQIDGIVFEVLSDAKVVVALIDRQRGPVMRTVEAEALGERTEAGPDDEALRLLVRRTPSGSRPTAPGGGSGKGAAAGHGRASMHRTTGK